MFDWRLASEITIPGDGQKRKLGAIVKADASGPSEEMIRPIASAMEHFKSAGLDVFDPVLDEMFYNCCVWFGVSDKDEKRLRRGETIGREELNGLGPETILDSFDKFSLFELGAPVSWEAYDMPTCDCHLTIDHKDDYELSIHVGFLNGKAIGACMEYC